MTFFQKIRSLWSGETELEEELTPIEELDGLIAKGEFLDDQLLKAGGQYDLTSDDKYLDECQELAVQIAENTQDIVDLQSRILTKSISIVALLPESSKEEVRELMGRWELTGQVYGEDIDSQLKAIVKAVDFADVAEEYEEFEKGQFVGKFGKQENEGSRGGHVIGHTKSGKPVYARLAGHHYPHFTKQDHHDAAKLHHGKTGMAPGENQGDYGKTGSVSMFWHKKKAAEHEHEADKAQKSEESELEKGGKRGAEGETRKWGNREFQKHGKQWVEVKGAKKNKPLPTAEIVAHAENTSTPRLKEIASDPAHPHHDSGKRELERRKSEKDAQKAKMAGPGVASAGTSTAEPEVRKSKPKPVKYEPNTDLEPHHRKVEKKFGKHLNKNFDYVRGQYNAKFGNVLNADNARELSEDYESNRAELSAAVHEPASSFIKKLYNDMLKEPVPKNKVNMVLFSAGGTGAGKTTGMNEHSGTKTRVKKAHIIYDTNMNTLGGAKEKIEKALAFGKRVHIVYTFRDPVDAFENGAIPRAQRIGRTVPIGSHVATHIGSLKTVQDIKNYYKDNKNVKVDVIDNSRGRGHSAIVPIGFLQDKQYIAEELQKKLNEITNKLHGEGKITDQHKKGFQAAGN